MTFPRESSIWFLDFRKGEAREIAADEHAHMVMEWQKRCTFKGGVCYVDCEPPDAP